MSEYVLTDQYTVSQVEALWPLIEADTDGKKGFMDNFPRSAHEFLQPISDGTMYLWMLLKKGEPIGIHWYHDRVEDAVWTAGWRRSDLRGLGAWPQVQANAEAMKNFGIGHFFAACRPNAIGGQRIIAKCGYKYVTTFHEFGWFDGQLGEIWAYSLRDDDADLLYKLAEKRAIYNRSHGEAVLKRV